MALAGRTPPRSRAGYPCALSKVMEELPDEERDALVGMLDENSGWSHAAIADALKEEGLLRPTGEPFNQGMIGRCRKECVRCSTAVAKLREAKAA